jgi:hypothetical protein
VKAEYASCSEALGNDIPIMDLLEAARSVAAPKTKILCKLFRDNSGACELMRLPTMRPHTKHIDSKPYCFRENVARGRISVQQVSM